MAALTLLGFSSGLPYALTRDTLQAWMSAAQVDLATIGLFSLVWVPYSFKFVWAPLMDRYVPLAALGRRRGWLLLTQAGLILSIAALAAVGPASLPLLAAVALAVAFLSASQDIAADAYRTDVLPDAERGAGAGVFVTGYRLALLLATGAALVVVGRYDVPWSGAYVAMALLMGVGVAATLIAPSPPGPAAPPATLRDAVVLPFAEFLHRPRWPLVVAFILLFPASDAMLNALKAPFLLNTIGFSLQQLGAINNSFGLALTIVGALVGGAVVARLGIVRSLWLALVLQAMSNLSFLYLLTSGPRSEALAAVVCVENLCAGLVTAAFVAFLMGQCSRAFSATQYALLSSLMAVTRSVVGAAAGFVAEATGWPVFLGVTVLVGVPAMLVLPWLRMDADQAGAVTPEN